MSRGNHPQEPTRVAQESPREGMELAEWQISKTRDAGSRILALFCKKFCKNVLLHKMWEEWAQSSCGKKLLGEASLHLDQLYKLHGFSNCTSFTDEVRKLLKAKIKNKSSDSDAEKPQIQTRPVTNQALEKLEQKRHLVTEVCESTIRLPSEGLFAIQSASLAGAKFALAGILSLEELELLRECHGSFGGTWTREWLPRLADELKALNVEREVV